MTKLKTNCFNYVLGSGKVTSIEHITNEGRPLSRFFLDYNAGKISVMIYNPTEEISRLQNGDYVMVEGKLRYSTRSGSYKIMAETGVVVQMCIPLVMIILEGAVTKMDPQEEALIIDFLHVHATPEGKGYKCPIQVSFKKTAEAPIMRRYNPGDTQVILGRLHGKQLRGTNMTSTTPIYINPPEAPNGTEK